MSADRRAWRDRSGLRGARFGLRRARTDTDSRSAAAENPSDRGRGRRTSSEPTAVPRSPGVVALRAIRSFVLPAMLIVTLGAAVVYFIFPTTTWLDQRAEAAEVQQELEVLLEEQQYLRTEIARLRTDDEVERIARRDFNFVFPGEEAYAVLPAPPAPVELPSSWPFNLLYAEVLD